MENQYYALLLHMHIFSNKQLSDQKYSLKQFQDISGTKIQFLLLRKFLICLHFFMPIFFKKAKFFQNRQNYLYQKNRLTGMYAVSHDISEKKSLNGMIYIP